MRDSEFYLQEFYRSKMISLIESGYGNPSHLEAVKQAPNGSFSMREETIYGGYCETCEYSEQVYLFTCRHDNFIEVSGFTYLFRNMLQELLDFTSEYDKLNPEE